MATSFLLVAACLAEAHGGAEGTAQQASPSAPVNLEWKQLDGNQINCTIANDGPFADYRRTVSAGLEWPAGSGRTTVYTAGIWLVGRHAPSESLRTAVMEFSSEFQPGPLLELFNSTTNDDTAPVARAGDPRYRLYKISRGDTLSADYQEWPGDLGAPYDDVNHNGQWDPGTDRPRLYGDQQVWTVINDVNNELHRALGATAPMGVEVRMLLYAFDLPAPLANTIFLEWTIINRSDAGFDSVYFGIWSDPDLGDAFDDFPGSDSTLSLGFVYNGDDEDVDPHGYGSHPPAAGFTLLSGPLVPGTATDSARLGDTWRGGFRNLPMTSYAVYTKNTYPELISPPDGSPAFAPEAYAYLQGMAGTVQSYITRADGSVITYMFSGDPLEGTGDLPENFPLGRFLPQEIRMMTNTGPFTLASGDTQFVAAAFVVAQGGDRLGSVSALKRDVKTIHKQFPAFRDSLSSWDSPSLSVAPGDLNFGFVQVGTRSDTLDLQLTNQGSFPIEVGSLLLPRDPGFTFEGYPPVPFSLSSGESRVLHAWFMSTTRGDFNDTIAFLGVNSTLLATPVSLHARGVEAILPARPGTLYGAGVASSLNREMDQDSLYVIDPETGTVTPVGPLDVRCDAALTLRPLTRTLTLVHGQYDEANRVSATIYGLSSETADLLPRTSLIYGENLYLWDTFPTTMAIDDDDVAYLAHGPQLYRSTLGVDSVEFVSDPDGIDRIWALTINPTTEELWAVVRKGSNEDLLVKLDKRTGAATEIGKVGCDGLLYTVAVSSIAFDADGLLYGLCQQSTTTNLISIDTTTAQGTLVAHLSRPLLSLAMRNDSLKVVSVPDLTPVIPQSYSLSQNYPNPFNPTTTIEYTLPHTDHVTLRIFNVLGEELTTLVERDNLPGTFKVTWDASHHPSGVYFYRLSAGEYVQTRKMVLIR